MPLASLRSDLPPALCETIHRAMAADHEQRPQTGEELRGALAKVWGGAPSPSIPPVRTRSAAPVPATTNRSAERVATLDTMPAKPRALAAIANTLPADQPAPAPAPAAVTTTSNASKLWLAMVVLAVIAIVLVIVLTR
jgi:hypothetical protein